MSTPVVTNTADLSDTAQDILLRPNRADRMTKIKPGERRTFRSMQGKSLVTDLGNDWYRLTDAGMRCREVLEAQQRETVPVQLALGRYGWVSLSEVDFGGHVLTTWTRDEHTLVLSFLGAYEVSAAIYDGVPLELDQVVRVVTSECDENTPTHVLTLAARRAQQVASPRFAFELSGLLSALAENEHHLLSVRTIAGELAAAILSTPHAR